MSKVHLFESPNNSSAATAAGASSISAFVCTLVSLYLYVYSHAGVVCSAPCILFITLLFFCACLLYRSSRGASKKWNHTAMSDCVDVCSCNTAQVHLTGKNTVAICHDNKGYLCKIRNKS